MANIEAKARKLFEDYTDAIHALENEYDDRKERLKANEAGETYIDEIRGLNFWFEEKENAIINLFVKQVKKISAG